ncbi:MAG TPA: hypothetical protein VG294_00475 [Solirubrobacteraceae bacterium]|nr:hypothetical protein [Solirubrobacteraceae bacterium]
MALARPRRPMVKAAFSVMATLRRRRQRFVEREYHRSVANGHLPREFGTPFYREIPRRRW